MAQLEHSTLLLRLSRGPCLEGLKIFWKIALKKLKWSFIHHFPKSTVSDSYKYPDRIHLHRMGLNPGLWLPEVPLELYEQMKNFFWYFTVNIIHERGNHFVLPVDVYVNKKVNQVQNATISLGGRSIHPFTLALYYDKAMEEFFFFYIHNIFIFHIVTCTL